MSGLDGWQPSNEQAPLFGTDRSGSMEAFARRVIPKRTLWTKLSEAWRGMRDGWRGWL